MASDRDAEKKQVGGELVIPGIAVAFTLYFFSTIVNSPWTAQVSAFLIGGVLMLVCAIFFVRTGLSVSRGEAGLGLGGLFGRRDLGSGRLGLFAATVGYCIFIDELGFTLATFLFLLVSMAILGRGRRLGLVTMISAAMALGGWAVFIWAFDTRFPRGWFETTMQAVLNHG